MSFAYLINSLLTYLPTCLHAHFNQIKNTLRSHFTTFSAVGGWVGVETEVNA